MKGKGEVVAMTAVRGAFAAMAMTGIRRVTTGLGLVEKPPPERIATDAFPHLLAQVPPDHRDEAIELAHWGYGAAAGAAFGALPTRVRRNLLAGPVYGLAIWLAFEAGVAPMLLGIGHTKHRPLRERFAIAADHVVYGLVLAARPRRI